MRKSINAFAAMALLFAATVAAPKPAKARCWGCWGWNSRKHHRRRFDRQRVNAYAYPYGPYYGYGPMVTDIPRTDMRLPFTPAGSMHQELTTRRDIAFIMDTTLRIAMRVATLVAIVDRRIRAASSEPGHC